MLALRFVTAIGIALCGQAETKGRVKPVLPGVKKDGGILLPNQWSLRPAGRQIELGDFPVHMELHPGGRFVAILHAGAGEHSIAIFDSKSNEIVSRAVLDQAFYGLCFNALGSELFASGGEHEVVHRFDFKDGFLTNHRQLEIVPPRRKFIPGGLAISKDAERLFVCGTFADALKVVDLSTNKVTGSLELAKESYPYAALSDGGRGRLYVSLWNAAAIAVIDSTTLKVVSQWPTESHPTEMALTADGKRLFVACANSTKVSVIDIETGKGLQTISCSLYPAAPSGNTPNSLCLTPDDKLLFVANADSNNLAAFNVEQPANARPLGFIPVGWYPTSVRFDSAKKRIYVTNGKGLSSKANPQGPNPEVKLPPGIEQYIARLFRGTLSVIDMPTPDQMAEHSKQAYRCSPLKPDQSAVDRPDAPNPIPFAVGKPSPIQHCIYIIKENRTYDQVLGDVEGGNGDENLCLFPESVTPNHHALAKQFVLLDNFYVDGEVSADGHEWSMAAYATDYTEKVWPLTYRPRKHKKIPYPAEGESGNIARPAGGYLWDRCAEAKVSYFSFGEFIENGHTLDQPGKARVKALEGHFDPWYRGFDMDYSDLKRADRFLAELKRFENEGSLPKCVILRLPNDHTMGTRIRKPTPRAFVAENDYALGRVIEGISKSKFWPTTAVFVVEDDAQNGPDHVDAHRTVALLASPYCKRGFVDSNMYSTSSMLRTMELILGLKPMSQFDAAARPMYGSFKVDPDFRPYEHIVPKVDLTETNAAVAFGSKISEKLDFTKEDAADDLVLSEIVWKAVKGAHSQMPPPVRAAFVLPHVGKDDDD